jgi:ASC-1-like (ASCH) protein
MSYSLFIQDPWFTAIYNGDKTIEGRIGSESKYASWKGQTALFTGPGNRSLNVLVTDVRHYDTLDDYLSNNDYTKIRADDSVKNRDELRDKYMDIYNKNGKQVFSNESIQSSGGINAIEFIIRP